MTWRRGRDGRRAGWAWRGNLAGVQLTFVTSFFTEWYGWAAFHPETGIYGAAL